MNVKSGQHLPDRLGETSNIRRRGEQSTTILMVLEGIVAHSFCLRVVYTEWPWGSHLSGEHRQCG